LWHAKQWYLHHVIWCWRCCSSPSVHPSPPRGQQGAQNQAKLVQIVREATAQYADVNDATICYNSPGTQIHWICIPLPDLTLDQ
jgi:hypothetical protein